MFMALVTDQSIKRQSFLDKPIFATLVINWELVLYGLIFIVAVVTRFYILGARVMSHDESLHALFSFKLYDGDGYKHDPLMHGPFQFHIVALSYLLFGDNDFSARIPAALFGVALAILPYWFRPWLGRIGALVTSLGLLISPSLLYYQRYIRNESFIVFFTALLALSLFQYMRTRQTRWLYWGAAAVSLSLSAKEVAFIHGFIGVLFIAGVLLWERSSAKRFKSLQWGLSALTILLLILTLFFASTLATLKVAGVILLLAGLVAALLTISRNVDRRHTPVSAALRSFKVPLETLWGPMILAVAIFVLLHTTFFTNPSGLVSGTVGAVTYWFKQQDVARGGQPGYYYLMLMSLYEFLPFFIGLIGGIVYLIKRAPSHIDRLDAEAIEQAASTANKRRAKDRTDADETSQQIYPSDGGTFAAYLIVWAIGSFVIYSWAGEKMPWLNTHIVLPFIFLTGHISQTVFDKFDWRVLKTRDGLLFTILVPLLGSALLALLSVRPFQGQSLDELRQTSQFFIAFLIFVAVGFGLWTYGRHLNREQIKPILYLVVFSLLTILTVRFAWLSSFVNYDLVNEFLVYAHAAPDVKWVLNEVDDISRRTVGDKQIKVAYGGVIWPLEWYMRDYPNRAFFGSNPSREALDAPVIIFSPDAEVSLTDVEPFLGDNYQRFRYRQVWWPIEDYKGLSFQRLWHTYVVPDPETDDTPETIRQNWRSLWDIIFYRHNDTYALSEWPFMTRMYFYVRKDIVNELWDYRTGPLTAAEVPVDPYTDVRQKLAALQVWGSEGSTEGRFLSPRAIAISPQGQVYVADSGNHRIQVFDQNGNFLKAWGGVEGANPGELTEPWGIAISEDGRVYVADTWNHRIQVFDEDGNFITEFGTFANTNGEVDAWPGAFWGPRGIAIDKEGNVYVADTGNKRIQKFTPDGMYLGVWGGGGVVPGRFEEPVDVAIDHNGNIYVTDTWNQRIQKFDSDFNFIAEWPVVGWQSEDVVNKPFITVDSQNRVYISDPQNYRIIVYDENGELLSTFGQYGQDVESFKLPLGLAVGEGDILFVLDSDNNRVMKFAFRE
jgi:uncharacterized protein (TIGR03663 family)